MARQAGTPNVNVAQLDDGSVFVGYAAADPFSPGGEGFAKETIAVKGSLAIAPGAAGPTVGGNVTAFPALEIYGERAVAGGSSMTTLAQMYPSIDDQWGPLAGLWRSVGVGDQGLMDRFVAPSGPLPLLLPTTELGPAANPPTVVTVTR